MTVIEGTTRAVKAYIESQIKDRAAGADAEQSFVTISRQSGAGGITIGTKLAGYLSELDKRSGSRWLVFDKNLVEKVLEENNLSKRIAEFMTEDKASEISDTLEELFELHPARFALVRKTSETIMRLARVGNAVLVGRGANIITAKLPGGFHVRLIGSLKKRTDHIKDYYGLSLKQAAQFVKKEDAGRKNYIKKYFGKNIDDPLLYHVVINTDLVSYDEAAKIIAGRVMHKAECC